VAYAELFAKSAFSFLEGASMPEELVSTAKQHGLHTLVVCDRDGLYGSVRTWKAAEEVGQRLGVGVEFSLLDSGLGAATLALLVEDLAGYQNLCWLLTQAHKGQPKGQGRLAQEDLLSHHQGLTLLLPVQLDVPSHAPLHAMDAWLPCLQVAFENRGFIGLFRRLDGHDEARLACAQDWNRRTGFPLVATGAPLFHERERKPLADIVHCIREGCDLESVGTAVLGNSEAYLRTDAEMHGLFTNTELVTRSIEVANRLKFSFSEVRYEFPCELLPGQTADQRLLELTQQGLLERYQSVVPDSVIRQVEKELGLIQKLGVAPYFLCTYEIVQIARAKRILCQGRGSAANSAVCYALGITAVDPARSNLLFERFLSAERNEPPDIDVDFEHERREEVIQEIYSRYGRDHAAMVSEVIRYQSKSALREVGKVFGLSEEQTERLSAMASHWGPADLDPKTLQEYGFDPDNRIVQQVVHWAKQLVGFPRHLSIHVGGFVLSKGPLSNIAPVEPAAMPGRTVLTWDKDDIDSLGFFKVDVLGLGMLTAIRKALELIHADGELQLAQETFNPLEVVTRVPAEDSVVYATISEADTVGVFQIESRAQMAMLPRLRPQCFYDLVIEVALVRPGPIQGGMVHPYLRRRNREEPITYPHPDLLPILKRTLGVPLFQEQVMQLSMVGAGYSAGQADQLRRDMAAWKKSGRLLGHRDQLLNGFAKKGIPREFAEALFEQIKGFGEYGFPESHAASFALLVYLSAWQKTHFPAHFVAALLNSQPMGFYSPASLIRDAQQHGVEVQPVCIVRSDWDCSLEPASSRSRIRSRYPGAQKSLRLGLRLIKGLSQEAVRRLEAQRAEAAFRSLDDVIRRAGLRRDEIDALAEAGALEALVPGRRQALWAARAPRSAGLFAAIDTQEPRVELPSLRKSEQLFLDYRRIGLSIDDHPIRHIRSRLEPRGVITAQQLGTVAHGRNVQVAGLVITRQRPATASGVVFLTLEDETGIVNAVLFSAVFERYSQVARHEAVILVSGVVERQVTEPRPGEVGRATPVIHLVAKELKSLELGVRVRSRDFH
jgi:error-prone DNA polymerase